MQDELIVNQIDFLPERYREAKIKRHASVWRLIVAVMFGALLASAAMYQQELLWQAQENLAATETIFQSATADAQRIGVEQASLAPLQSEAALFTYLRHPWPRTQILSGLLGPLPESAHLRSLHVSFEITEKPVVVEASQTIAEQPADKTPSPARDLKRLRSELDGGRWVVAINGSTTDVPKLHEYLGTLEQNKLFQKVELVSIGVASSATTSSGDSQNSQFAVRVTVRPGYGQPGGPVITNDNSPTTEVAAIGGAR